VLDWVNTGNRLHPTQKPVQILRPLIDAFCRPGGTVLDPFCGSGSTLVAAARSGRDAVGYDLDPAYVALAETRLAQEVSENDDGKGRNSGTPAPARAKTSGSGKTDGISAAALARQIIEAAGFADVRADRRLRKLGLAVSFTADDRAGRTWYFDLAGTHSAYRGGMARSETVWRTLGRAHVMATNDITPLVVLTTQLPRAGTEPDRALRAAGPGAIFDAVDLLSPGARQRLASYARGRHRTPLPGFWSAADLAPGAV
jgi:hypothetical protein